MKNNLGYVRLPRKQKKAFNKFLNSVMCDMDNHILTERHINIFINACKLYRNESNESLDRL